MTISRNSRVYGRRIRMSQALSGISWSLGSSLITDVLIFNSELYISSRLEDVSRKYMKAIEKHRDTTLKGKMNSYIFKAKDVREQVDNFRREVGEIKQKFIVCCACRSRSRHGADAPQVQCIIDMRASQTYMGFQGQTQPDVVTTQITTAISYSRNDASSNQDRTGNVSRVVQETVTRRQCTLSSRRLFTVRTNAHI